ncbi:MAG: manganese efflux pump MntP family protein [Thermoanaerobacterales bacterium]|nr:manganese efflux pump MntP family protein [Thermoanaerobacterales bacterium]
MDVLLTYFLVAVALGADAFSLALGLGMNNPCRRYILRTSLCVGVFHVFMPLAGILVGGLLGTVVGNVAVWIGGTILVLLGLKMVRDGWPWRRDVFSFKDAKATLSPQKSNPFCWAEILGLSWCVSVDAFGAGVGIGVTISGLSSFVIILGVVAALMTAAGLLLGRWLGNWTGKWAEMLGGLVLIAIGIKMFIE